MCNIKLFITNKTELDSNFDYNPNLPKSIHKEAFNELKYNLEIKHSIPLMLIPSYSKEGVCLFRFEGVKDNVYFYSYETTCI